MCDTFLPPPATNGVENRADSLPQTGERAEHTTSARGGRMNPADRIRSPSEATRGER
ncbi:hypothetical protein ACF07W_15330 [Streptomyces sp. NPDC015140]|uniref:hypothetical protein n=1 Tax=Streptomyces sp. NPDC015140 TaxID=3364943 RepID=UPI0036F654AB